MRCWGGREKMYSPTSGLKTFQPRRMWRSRGWGVDGVSADASIVMREVTKRHGTTVAVDHLSLTIRKGEFFAILGPSGSGKTTTLRLLAGFEQPDAGEISIEGQPMQGVPPNRRPVNLVFQNYALFPHMTVAQNVAFGLEMKGLPSAEIGPRVG